MGVLLESVPGMDARLSACLRDRGVEELFPVQATVWRETAGGASSRHDVCIAAPTGSGKTLAYCLPVVSALAREALPSLRALVVLPTRDLAGQVFSVLGPLCSALGLGLGLAAGRASAEEEAAMLAADGLDVLVATPGRLARHVGATPGFTLHALRFLVVDECDRLLRQAYQGWLATTLAAEGGSGRVVKVIVSATLTKDPAKLLRLGLHAPRFLSQTTDARRYSLPRSLKEYKHVVPAERKPEALVTLLCMLGHSLPTLVFASSVETTTALQRLLTAVAEVVGPCVEYSSRLGPDQRRRSLEAFSSGAARAMVCSDAMTRGMDVAGVGAVVNYDAPVYAKTYVHRAGRTARAGAAGKVYTLLRREDVKHFKAMLRKADNTFVADAVMDKAVLANVGPVVAQALQHLGQGEVPSAADTTPMDNQSGKGGRPRPPKRRKFVGLPTLTLVPGPGLTVVAAAAGEARGGDAPDDGRAGEGEL